MSVSVTPSIGSKIFDNVSNTLLWCLWVMTKFLKGAIPVGTVSRHLQARRLDLPIGYCTIRVPVWKPVRRTSGTGLLICWLFAYCYTTCLFLLLAAKALGVMIFIFNVRLNRKTLIKFLLDNCSLSIFIIKSFFTYFKFTDTGIPAQYRDDQ